MGLLIVVFDLYNPARETAVLSYIKSRPEWAKVSNSSYLIETVEKETAVAIVKDAIAKAAKDEITCFVGRVTDVWAGHKLIEEATALMQKRALPYRLQSAPRARKPQPPGLSTTMKMEALGPGSDHVP